MNEFNGKYIRLKSEYILRQYVVDGKFHSAIWNLFSSEVVELTNNGVFLIQLLTGKNKYENILKKFLEKYKNIDIKNIEKNLFSILKNINEKGIIELSKKPLIARKIPKKKYMRGLLNSVYLRLTNSCNLNCLHCSVNAGKKMRKTIA